MKILLRKLLLITYLAGFIFLLPSCEKFEGEQEIPAYISIDSIGLHNSVSYDGSLSAKITDVWVYIDDQLIGGYELPATIPVLDKGLVNMKIRPGIMLNGLINTRAAYPFFDRIEMDINIAEDSITNIGTQLINGKNTLFTSYAESCIFAWQENFEDAFISLDTTSLSTVNIELTPNDDPNTFEGLHSGIVRMSEDDDVFEVVTREAYVLPQDGTPVFLEMNYKNNSPFTVGIVIYEDSYPTYHAMLVYNAHEDWNKVYITLTQAVSSAYGATSFKIFFGAGKSSAVDESIIYLDNLRLIHQ